MKNFTKSIATLFASSIVLFSFGAKAQNSFEVGTSAINLGIGLLYSYDYATGPGVSQSPVISGSYEYGVTKLGPGTLGLGAQLAYQGASYSYSDGIGDTYSWKGTSFLFGVRGVYHPDFLQGDKYDVYGALQLSYVDRSASASETGPNAGFYNFSGAAASSFYPYIIIGGRYYFTNNIGVWAELGYSLAYLNLGLSIKFGSSGGGK